MKKNIDIYEIKIINMYLKKRLYLEKKLNCLIIMFVVKRVRIFWCFVYRGILSDYYIKIFFLFIFVYFL